MATVNDFSPFLGQPIRSVQTFLRELGNQYEDIPTVIPDGIFGEQTQASVIWFQNKNNLPATGVVDKTTWDLLVAEYLQSVAEREAPLCINLLPEDFVVIRAGEENILLYPIQAMLKNLANEFENIPDLEITGVHDENSVATVKQLQTIIGKEAHGNLDKVFWNDLIKLYETHISRKNF